MDFKVRISDSALADLEEIVEYSWINFAATSERFGKALLNHTDLLKSFPYIGSPVGGRPGVRQIVHTPIMIYYRIHEESKTVEILHFWHRSRKGPRL